MKAKEINIKCIVNESEDIINIEVEFMMKEPNASLVVDVRSNKFNSSNDIESLSEAAKIAITQAMPHFIEGFDRYRSKEHAEFLKENIPEDYQEYIKWFPENA